MNLQRRRTSVGAHYKVRFHILRSIYEAKDIFTAGHLLNDLVEYSIPTEPHLLFELSKVASMMSTVWSNANLRLVHKVYSWDGEIDLVDWLGMCKSTPEYRISRPSKFSEAANEGWLLSYDDIVRHYGMARYKYSRVRKQLDAHIKKIHEEWDSAEYTDDNSHPAKNWSTSLSGLPMHFAYMGAPFEMIFDGYDWDVYYKGELLKDANVGSFSEGDAFVERFLEEQPK